MNHDAFIAFLLEYNEKVNLVSRHSTPASLAALVAESLLLQDLIAAPRVIDAGSGNGLLGIPLATVLPGKRFVLVESIGKKADFLRRAIQELRLGNAEVWQGNVLQYVHAHGEYDSALLARGFPRVEALAEFVIRRRLRQLLLITSPAKSEKIRNHVANVRQNRYNIPFRDNLIVLRLESVSRETGPS